MPTLASNGGAVKAYMTGEMGMFTLNQGDVLQIMSGAPNDCKGTGADMQVDGNGYTHTYSYCDLGPQYDLTGTEAVATGAFELVQYLVGQNYSPGDQSMTPDDPAMALSVPIEQFRKQYTFLTPDTYTFNYVNVAAPADLVVTLDGKDLDPGMFQPVGNGKYGAARIAIKAGPHTISCAQPLGITVYGLAPFTAYIYPGGLDVNQINVQ